MKIGLQSGVWSSSIGLLLAGAGALAGASPQQLLLQIIGWVSIAFGAGLFVWGLTIRGGLWWKARLTRRRDEWISLGNALLHLLRDSQWAREHSTRDRNEAENILRNEFFDAAARGDIHVRGYRRMGGLDGKLTNASEQIPREFWRTANMQPFFEVQSMLSPLLHDRPDPIRPAVWSDRSRFPDANIGFFGKVTVSAEDVFTQWPPARRHRFKKASTSKIDEAFRRYLEEIYGGYNQEFDNEVEMLMGSE